MTLMRYINKCKSQQNPVAGYTAVTLSNFVISSEMEEDLDQHIKMLGDIFFGPSWEQCKEVACEFATKNKLKVPSSWEKNKKAGKSC